MTERLAGDTVDVLFPAPSGVDPRFWEPDADVIGDFQSADLLLLNGADYAKWTLRSSLPLSRTVLTTEGVSERLIEVPEAITHSHGDEGEHSHSELASKTWLDPELAIAQAGRIKDELQTLTPDSASAINENFEDLVNDLNKLDQEFEAVPGADAVNWIATSSDFAYFGRRYSLDLQFANWMSDDSPPEEKWAAFEASLEKEETTLVLSETELSEANRARLQKLGVEVVLFNSGEQRPDTGDYLSIMRGNLDRLNSSISNSVSDSP